MGPDKTFTVTATMPERWVPQFLGMLRSMEQNGRVGHSSKVSFYADGDGDFRPKFEWDDDLPEPELPERGEIFDAG